MNDNCKQQKDNNFTNISAKGYIEFVKERFCFANKSLTGILMAELMSMKYNRLRSMQEHIIEMTNIATRLKTLGLALVNFFLVQFIINSLPSN